MYFKQERAITTLSCKPRKLEVLFVYFSSLISSTEIIVNIHLEMAWTAIEIIDHMEIRSLWYNKSTFIQEVTASVQLYISTTWTLTKKKKKNKKKKKARWELNWYYYYGSEWTWG